MWLESPAVGIPALKESAGVSGKRRRFSFPGGPLSLLADSGNMLRLTTNPMADAQDALARASGEAAEDPSKELAELAAEAELPLDELRRRVYGGDRRRLGSRASSLSGDMAADDSDGAFSSDDFGSEEEEEEEEQDKGRARGGGRDWAGFGDREREDRKRSGEGSGLEALLNGVSMADDHVDAWDGVRSHDVGDEP